MKTEYHPTIIIASKHLLKQNVMKFKKKQKKNTTIEIFQPNNQRAESNARTAI